VSRRAAGTSWAAGPVTVRAPATSANLGPGFDSLGLALGLHDYVTAQVTPFGLDVNVTGMGAHTAGAGERHLVVRAVRAGLDAIGEQPPGISISCRNEVPHGFGLGSSAAAIVAGLVAARALAGPDGKAAFPDDAVLALATEIEGHPDNVAACLLGGLVVSWRSGETVRAARLEPLAGLAPVVCLPAVPMPTEAARKVLPAQVPHADAVANSARVALLITALTSRPDLLLAGTEDFLHQGYRAAAMPETAGLIGHLREAGIAAAVSGAGPSVLAFPANVSELKTVSDLVAAVVASTGRWQVLRLAVDTAGATLVP
jgi:homoserine kinase